MNSIGVVLVVMAVMNVVYWDMTILAGCLAAVGVFVALLGGLANSTSEYAILIIGTAVMARASYDVICHRIKATQT